ncbi:hypothetical protein DFJ73DRAFT_847665 [Zopfochytrium polystomum]|nr:hypothetical protein DFJ73DRAFT_847665 [Zopfochytrium polystomum]
MDRRSTIGGRRPLPLRKSLSSAPRLSSPSQSTPPSSPSSSSAFSRPSFLRWMAPSSSAAPRSSDPRNCAPSPISVNDPEFQPALFSTSSETVTPQRGRRDFKLKLTSRRPIRDIFESFALPPDKRRAPSSPGGQISQTTLLEPKTVRSAATRQARSASISARSMHILENKKLTRVGQNQRENLVPKPFPNEVWLRVISFLPNPAKAGQLCRDLHGLIQDYHTRKVWFVARYGLKLSAYRAVIYHTSVVDLKLTKLLVNEGAAIPRFLIQRLFQKFSTKTATQNQLEILEWLVMEYSRIRKQISLPLSVFEDTGHSPDGVSRLPNNMITTLPAAAAESLFNCDDARAFDTLMNDPTPANLATLREMIYSESFVPLVDESPTYIFRIFQIFCEDLEMFDHLIKANGLDVRPLNTLMLRWAFSSPRANDSSPLSESVAGLHPDSPFNGVDRASPRPVPSLSVFIERGFKLNSTIVKHILRESSASELDHILHLMAQFVSHSVIESSVASITAGMFGSAGTAKPELLTKFYDMGFLKEEAVKACLLVSEGAGFTASAGTDGLPFQSKCFEQGHPYLIWRWVLETFGPSNELARASFDDLMLWLGELPSRLQHFRPLMYDALHPFELPILFLQYGVPLRPRHIVHLARAARAPGAAPVPALILEGARRAITSISVIPNSSRRRSGSEASRRVSSAAKTFSSHSRRRPSSSPIRSSKRSIIIDGYNAFSLDKRSRAGTDSSSSGWTSGGPGTRQPALIPIKHHSGSQRVSVSSALSEPLLVHLVGTGGGGWADGRAVWQSALLKVSRNKSLCSEIVKANGTWLEERDKRRRRAGGTQDVDMGKAPIRFLDELNLLVKVMDALDQ